MSISHVLHVTSWLSRAGGGIPPVIWSLTREMQALGIECHVAGLQDQWNGKDIPDSIPTTTAAVIGPLAMGYSRELNNQLSNLTQSGTAGTAIHTHGLWMYPGVVARSQARRTGCPLVISPHGMLEPWALQNSRWKKRVVSLCFENKNLKSADCLHALCSAEAENFRRFGLKNPIAVIPNGIGQDDLRSPTSADGIDEEFPQMKERQRILFLSRLHPKKGLENLLQAWRQLAPEFSNWCLIIAGSGDPAYELNLKTFVVDSGLDRNVLFLGAIYGEAKKRVLAAADVFVLPSYSEGFSMAVLEAAAAGLPVLLTSECNFPELTKAGAAVEVSPEARAVAAGLRQILELSTAERKAMGQRGFQLVSKSYTWPVIARQMCEVYQWLIGKGRPPECVRLA